MIRGPRILLSRGRKPPTEFRVIPFGAYETTKGTFALTHSGARNILAQLKDEGVDIAIDWEHDMVARMGPGPTPAAGWCNIEMRTDGLWAVNVKWTPEAARMLSTAEYRYFSPAFTVNEETGEITSFINLALTNRPATKKLEPLVAAARRRHLSSKGILAMNKKFLAALAKYMSDNKLDHKAMSEKAGLDTERLTAADYEPSQEEMAKVCKAMGVELSALDGKDMDKVSDGDGDDDEETDEIAAGDTVNVPGEEKFEKLSRQFTDIMVTLTGEENPQKAVGVLAAMKEKAMRYDEDHKALVALKREREEEKRERLLEKGKAEGKLTPSLVKMFSKKPVEALEEFLVHAPVIAGAPIHEVEAGSPIAILTREDKEVAKLLGRDVSEVAKGIEDERNGKFEAQILASYSQRRSATK